MIPGLGLIEKLVIFAIDLFVQNSVRKQALLDSFNRFFRRTGSDSQVSADLKEQYDRYKEEKEWKPPAD